MTSEDVSLTAQLHTVAPKPEEIPDHEATTVLAVVWTDTLEAIDRAHALHHLACASVTGASQADARRPALRRFRRLEALS